MRQSRFSMKTIVKVKAAIPQPGNGQVMEHAALVLHDDRIIDLLSWEEAEAAYPDAAVDFRPEAWAVPGFIDAHVHLSFSCRNDPYLDMLEEMNSEPLMMLRLVRNAQASILAGVTTVRDCGAATDGIFQLRDAIREGTMRGSSIVASGRPFTVTGGHCWYLNREVEGEENVRRAQAERAQSQASTGVVSSVNPNLPQGTSSLESHTSSAEEAAPAEPKKILRVGEKCFAAPKKTVFMLNTECSKVATLFGLHACPLKDVKDEWAGAVRTCGGIGRMPTMDDLLALARVLYSSNSIAISEKDKVQIKAYGKFSEKPSGTDNMSFNDLIYVPDIAQKLYMPEASEEGFSIWGNTEISPEYALAVTYGKNAVKYNSATLRTSENFYTMCQVSCE